MPALWISHSSQALRPSRLVSTHQAHLCCITKQLIPPSKHGSDSQSLFNFYNVSQLQIGVGDSNAWLYVIAPDGRKYRATLLAS